MTRRRQNVAYPSVANPFFAEMENGSFDRFGWRELPKSWPPPTQKANAARQATSLQRQARARELKASGRTISQIAEEVELSDRQVQRLLKKGDISFVG